jgi:hypothetical protein
VCGRWCDHPGDDGCHRNDEVEDPVSWSGVWAAGWGWILHLLSLEDAPRMWFVSLNGSKSVMPWRRVGMGLGRCTVGEAAPSVVLMGGEDDAKEMTVTRSSPSRPRTPNGGAVCCFRSHRRCVGSGTVIAQLKTGRSAKWAEDAGQHSARAFPAYKRAVAGSIPAAPTSPL